MGTCQVAPNRETCEQRFEIRPLTGFFDSFRIAASAKVVIALR